MIPHMYTLTPRDEQVLRWQLKGTTDAVAGIFEKCDYGFPQIVLLSPKAGSMVDYQSLSNILWLTCPYLNDEIHELENKGYIAKIETFINTDEVLKREMLKAHSHFYFFRKSVYEKYIHKEIEDEYLHVMKRGIGGLQEPVHLKCLHLHYAHYRICESNIAGRIVYHLLQQKVNCDDAICRVSLQK